MKFKGMPGEWIRERYKINSMFKLRTVGQFDENGIFETEDVRLIEKLKVNYAEADISHDLLASDSKPHSENKCKYCGEEFEKKGQLLAHYRKCEKR